MFVLEFLIDSIFIIMEYIAKIFKLYLWLLEKIIYILSFGIIGSDKKSKQTFVLSRDGMIRLWKYQDIIYPDYLNGGYTTIRREGLQQKDS